VLRFPTAVFSAFQTAAATFPSKQTTVAVLLLAHSPHFDKMDEQNKAYDIALLSVNAARVML
jgi:hypothetical protein